MTGLAWPIAKFLPGVSGLTTVSRFLPDRSWANRRCIAYREVKETLETCDRSQNVGSHWTAK